MKDQFNIKGKTIVITGEGGVLCGTMAKVLAEAVSYRKLDRKL